MTVVSMVRKALLAGIGAKETVTEFVDELVKKGELSKTQGADIVKDWAAMAEMREDTMCRDFSGLVKRSLEMMNLPTRDDIERINRKLYLLSERVRKLEGIDEDAQETDIT